MNTRRREEDELDRDSVMNIVRSALEVEAIVQAMERLDDRNAVERQLADIRNDFESRVRVLARRWDSMLQVLRRLQIRAAGRPDGPSREDLKASILAVFPPEGGHRDFGVQIARASQSKELAIDCQSRLPLCGAVCCSLRDVHLTVEETANPKLDWDPLRPYCLSRQAGGCTHLEVGKSTCEVYQDRPLACRTYDCRNDPRIWKNFEARIPGPAVRRHLTRRAACNSGISDSDVPPPDFSSLRKLLDHENS